MGKVTILKETIKNPLSFMGAIAGTAYNSDTSSQEKNKKRGLECVRAGHGRMWEFCDVFVEIEGYSSRFARELMRHVGDGLTCIQRSTRYVNEDNYEYYTPPSIKKNPVALEAYETSMNEIQATYNHLVQNLKIHKEDAANILPLGMDTVLVIKHNARTWIQMAEVRLCNRAYIEFRQFMKQFMQALKEYSPEWRIIVDEFFKCKCETSEWCLETYGCGKKPQLPVVKVHKVERKTH